MADDDADIRDLVAFKLRESGYRVVTAPDGPTALAAAVMELPDLAVLDVTMPGMSGTDVCRALRADPATAGMAVIVLTARAPRGRRASRVQIRRG